MESASIAYTEINRGLLETVTCQICGEELGHTGFHLWYKHSIRAHEHRDVYPGAQILSERLRNRQLKSATALILPHWEFIWTKEYICDRVAEYLRLGYAVSHYSIVKIDESLRTAAKEYFGNWQNALRGWRRSSGAPANGRSSLSF